MTPYSDRDLLPSPASTLPTNDNATSAGSDALNLSSSSSTISAQHAENTSAPGFNTDESIGSGSKTPPPEASRVAPHPLIRLIQCPICSLPLRIPLRLPCGKTICRSCLPPLKQREGIAHLRGASSGLGSRDARRDQGFVCPWKDKGCGNERVPAEHALDDCGVDVVLGRILDVFENVLRRYQATKQRWSGTEYLLEWKMPPPTTTNADPGPDGQEAESITEEKIQPEQTHKATSHWGRYLGTYLIARGGGIPYAAENMTYTETDDIPEDSEDRDDELANDQSSQNLDEFIYEHLRSGIREELDCQVCYGLIIDPCISPCGHSFCYECANRIRDNSNLCPLCRKKMYISFREGSSPVHSILRHFLDSFCSDEIKSRKETMEVEGVFEEGELPLFVCTLAYPSVPTYLHIFEPRYRLLIRRALDYGNGKFGMVAHNFYHDPAAQAHPDRPLEPFMQYGTVVRIEWREFLPDGRIMLTAVGTHKFKVVRYGLLDGYYQAHVERVDDINLAEEEMLEARELAAAADTTSSRNMSYFDTLSTQQLMQICMDFLEKQRTNSAPAVRERVNRVFGQPPTDPAIFAYWFANVLPIPDEEAYKILPMTSVRERLKVAATWPNMLEDSGWYVFLIPSIDLSPFRGLSDDDAIKYEP